MTDTQEGTARGEELVLLARYERARREAQELWMQVRGNREAARAVDAAAREAQQLTPLWVVHAMTVAHNQAYGRYYQALDGEAAALADLSRWEDRKVAALTAGAADLAAGRPLSAEWAMSDDGSQWRKMLPDGRTAVIEPLDDGTSFLPKVHESASDFAVGPVCAGLLAAANWADGQVNQ